MTLPFGRQSLELDVPPERLVGRYRGPAPLPDPAAAVRDALEAPRDFPPLRRALTPDDHVAVVVDESLPVLDALLAAVLEHVTRAGVAPSAITLLCPTRRPVRPWLHALRQAYPGVTLEEHAPGDRRRLSYLAGTAAGRAVYLNRTLVDADQAIVLTGRHFDAVLGHAGGEGDLFPALADETTRAEVEREVNDQPPTREPWPALAEAREVSWLLGAPFFVQLIPAAGDGVAAVVAGPAAACAEGQRLLEEAWRVRVPRRADTALVTLTGPGDRVGFAELAAAAANAARVVVPGGRVVILSEAAGELPAGCELIARADDLGQVLASLVKAAPVSPAALRWARAVGHARVSVMSGLAPQAVEELFAAPLAGAEEARRLVAEGGDCVVLEDGHRLLAVVA